MNDHRLLQMLALLSLFLFSTNTLGDNCASCSDNRVLERYWGTAFQHNDMNGTADSQVSSFTVRMGQHIGPSLAFEGAFTLPTSSNNIDGGTSDLNQSMDFQLAGRFKKGLASFEKLETYGILGLKMISLNYVSNGFTQAQASLLTTDLSYGLGAQVRLKGVPTAVNFEYSRLLTTHVIDINTFEMGLNFYF